MKKILIVLLALGSLSALAQPASRMFEPDNYTFQPVKEFSYLEDYESRSGKKGIAFETEGHIFNCSQVFPTKIKTNIQTCTKDKLELELNYDVRARFSGSPRGGYRTSLWCINPSQDIEVRELKVKLPENCDFSISSGGEVVVNGYTQNDLKLITQIKDPLTAQRSCMRKEYYKLNGQSLKNSDIKEVYSKCDKSYKQIKEENDSIRSQMSDNKKINRGV